MALEIGGAEEAAVDVPEQLLVNARKDVFVSWAAAGVRRLHLGSDYDLSDI